MPVLGFRRNLTGFVAQVLSFSIYPMTFLIALTLFIVVAIRFLTPEQRMRLTHSVRESAVRFHAEARRPRPEYEPFRNALAARTPRVWVTPAIAALNVLLFLCVMFSAAGSTAEALVAWGANFGPATTTGQWWRLVTASFVSSSIVELAIATLALIQIGLILERIVGAAAFAAAFVGSGLLVAIAGLSSRPVEVMTGSSGGVAGLYGLLAVVLAMNRIRQTEFSIPTIGIRRLAPLAVAFMLYCLFSTPPEIVGVLAGAAYGAVLIPGLAAAFPPIRRTGAALGAALVITVALAFPLRGGIADARPAVAHVVDVERTTATAYDEAVQRFRKGRVTVEALVKMIEQTIEPELHAAALRLDTLEGVPPNQKPLVADAREFVRLRGESWRLRAEGLKKTNMRSLQQAERTERASFEALEKISAVGAK
jgi:membrane associated rhomboid family serine protease